MKSQRVKAARYIHNQSMNADSFPKDAVFSEEEVDISDLFDHGRYCGGLIYLPSIVKSWCMHVRRTATANAAHFDGTGLQSYGTTFQLAGYDTNHHLFPLVFAHFVGPEK